MGPKIHGDAFVSYKNIAGLRANDCAEQEYLAFQSSRHQAGIKTIEVEYANVLDKKVLGRLPTLHSLFPKFACERKFLAVL